MTTKSPGEIISSDILRHMNVRPAELARAMGITPGSVSRILSGKAAITPETAIRLEVVLNEKAEYWMELQAIHDIAKARATLDVGSLIQLEAKSNLHSARATLEAMFNRHLGSDKRIQLVELLEISELCGVHELFMLMRQVDPQRQVFDYPIIDLDRGIHGLRLINNCFTVCSNIYGHEIWDAESRLSSEFIAQAYKAYDDGLVSGRAMVVWNTALGVPGLLVVEVLEEAVVPFEVDCLELQNRIKAPVACYAELKDGHIRERALLTSFVSDPTRFDEISDIYSELEGLAAQWFVKALVGAE